MQKIKAIAIDDEPIALEVIQTHASKTPIIDLKNTFVSATDALFYLKQEPISLIFLDINMPDLTGIEFSTMIDPSVSVIFTTAYPEYAVKGFELNALDYLLKPITYNRYLKACEKAFDRMNEKETNNSFFVKDGQSLVRIDLENLVYIEADGNYLTFYEKNKKVVSRQTLTEIANRLPKDAFVRINKSCIIAVKKVEKVDYQDVIVGGFHLPLLKSYRETLMALLKL